MKGRDLPTLSGRLGQAAHAPFPSLSTQSSLAKPFGQDPNSQEAPLAEVKGESMGLPLDQSKGGSELLGISDNDDTASPI